MTLGGWVMMALACGGALLGFIGCLVLVLRSRPGDPPPE